MSKSVCGTGRMGSCVVKFLSLVVVVGIFSGVDASEPYFTVKYQLPAGIPVGWGGLVFGAGINRDDGMFIGLDVNIFSLTTIEYWGGIDGAFDEASDGKTTWEFEEDDGVACFYGGGLSIGKIYKYSDNIQFVYGWNVGYWYSGDFTYDGKGGTFAKEEDVDYTYISTHSFLAPFFKTRWKFLEISYKAFLGTEKATTQRMGTKTEGKGRFGFNNHELSVGFYLGK